MDSIEPVLLTDPNYLAEIERIDNLLETKTVEELEEITEEASVPLHTNAVDDALESDDVIDGDVDEYIAVMNSITSSSDEDILDYFISKGGAKLDD